MFSLLSFTDIKSKLDFVNFAASKDLTIVTKRDDSRAPSALAQDALHVRVRHARTVPTAVVRAGLVPGLVSSERDEENHSYFREQRRIHSLKTLILWQTMIANEIVCFFQIVGSGLIWLNDV